MSRSGARLADDYWELVREYFSESERQEIAQKIVRLSDDTLPEANQLQEDSGRIEETE